MICAISDGTAYWDHVSNQNPFRFNSLPDLYLCANPGGFGEESQLVL